MSRLRIVFLFWGVLFFLAPLSLAHADVPLAARLLGVPYNDSTDGGLVVTVNNLNRVRGIANDGTTLYLLDGNDGHIVTVPMSALVGNPGTSITVSGTSHAVGWGVNGAPTVGTYDTHNLAYSHGCVFMSDDSTSPISLYCIDTSDWSVTKIAVPADYPMPAGHSWGTNTLIDFADGRIGKVSAYEATSSPETGYDSYVRMYTVSGTGKDVTIAFSHDYYMFDSENWNTDDHGIATDGTYLYRIENSGSSLSDGDFKSWPLEESGVPSQEYVGFYTEPFSNMTYLSHDHTGDRYFMGNYNLNQIYVTTAADPGPGPGNPLTPSFGSVTQTSDGYTVQVSNYDNSFTWAASASQGSASINDSGLVTVTGLSPAQTSTTTVTTSKSNFPNGSGTIVGSSTPDTTPPVISAIATSTASSNATIAWTTKEAASSEVVYSVDNAYASTTQEVDTSPRVTSHSATVNDLLASPCIATKSCLPMRLVITRHRRRVCSRPPAAPAALLPLRQHRRPSP